MSIPYSAHEFGLRVKSLRQIKKMTQEELSEVVRVSTRQLRRIEAGQGSIHFSTLERLAQILDVNIVQLFMFPEEMSRCCGSSKQDRMHTNTEVSKSCVQPVWFSCKKSDRNLLSKKHLHNSLFLLTSDP